MLPLDPASLALTKLGEKASEKGTEAVKEAEGLLTRLLGPAVDELGEAFAFRVRSVRNRSYLRLMKRTKRMLEEAGITPREVVLKGLLPIIDAATLEDDEGLSEKWAALLANAAAGEATDYLPAFAEILRQISPTDADLLDVLAEAKEATYHQVMTSVMPPFLFPFVDLYAFSGVASDNFPEFEKELLDRREMQKIRFPFLSRLEVRSPERLQIAADNLIRLGLVKDYTAHNVPLLDDEGQVISREENGSLWAVGLPNDGREQVGLSPLGAEFMRACSTPKPPSPTSSST